MREFPLLWSLLAAPRSPRSPSPMVAPGPAGCFVAIEAVMRAEAAGHAIAKVSFRRPVASRYRRALASPGQARPGWL